MITADDILRLPCTPELVEEGIEYACRTLSHDYVGPGRTSYERLRRAAARAIVELAFRRHLAEKDVPFGVRGAVPFGDPIRYFVVLRGRRCDIRTFLITDPRQARSTLAQPSLVLSAPALVPIEDYAAEGQSLEDMYLFAFVLDSGSGTGAGERAETIAEASMDFIHLMPKSWVQPRSWNPLGPVSMKAEGAEELQLEIGGQDRERRDIVRGLRLEPRARQELEDDFHEVSYVRVRRLPTGRLGIHSPARDEAVIIDPTDWHNVSIDAADILLAGWITRQEFRQRASLVRAGSRVFQFKRTRTNNLAIQVSELKPLARLLERARTPLQRGL